MDSYRSAPRRSLLLLTLAGSYALLIIAFRWASLIDDAYIFLRYAERLGAGAGYTFNPGVWVEGTTSVTWTLLLVPFAQAGFPLVSVVHALTILIIGLIVVVLWRTYARYNLPPLVGFALTILLLAHPHFVRSLLMGLETGLYSLLLLVLAVEAGRRPEHARAPVLGMLGILLFLTRPESLALLALLTLSWFLVWRTVPAFRTAVTLWIVGIGLVCIGRWLLFGALLPNSVQAKSALAMIVAAPDTLWPRMVAGATYLRGFVGDSPTLPLVGILATAMLLRHRPTQAIMVAASVVGASAAILFNSGDWMPLYRLATPMLPLLALASGATLAARSISLPAGWKRVGSALLLVGTILLGSATLYPNLSARPFYAAGWPAARCYVAVGHALRPVLNSSTVVAPEAIGIFGYEFSDVPVFDFFGLTEPKIATEGVMPLATYTLGKHYYAYTMQEQPALFLFHSHPSNHIPLLNKYGYSEQYRTYRVSRSDCELLVGMQVGRDATWRSLLEAHFNVEPVESTTLVQNPAATWPQGER